jgi:hypothetical protein
MEMSDTSEKIESISDPGAFKTLGIRVLKKIDQDCRAIILLGQNVAGKPIPGPIDGFGRVPGSGPSRYVTAAFTTTSVAKLERKWLSNGAPSSRLKPRVKAKSGKAKRKRAPRELGDLIKAARNTGQLRVAEPDAHFIVYLCTHRRLENELLKKVLVAAARLKVEFASLIRRCCWTFWIQNRRASGFDESISALLWSKCRYRYAGLRQKLASPHPTAAGFPLQRENHSRLCRMCVRQAENCSKTNERKSQPASNQEESATCWY